MENRGYRSYELEQDDEPRLKPGRYFLLGLAIGAVLLVLLNMCAPRPARAEGEVVTLYFACEDEDSMTDVAEASDQWRALEAFLKAGRCVAYDGGAPAVLGTLKKAYMMKTPAGLLPMGVYEVWLSKTQRMFSVGPVVK